MASRQYFDLTAVNRRGKTVKATAVVVGGPPMTDEEAMDHIQRTNFPHADRPSYHLIKSAKGIDSAEEVKSREAGAPGKVRSIFHVMEEAEAAAAQRQSALLTPEQMKALDTSHLTAPSNSTVPATTEDKSNG